MNDAAPPDLNGPDTPELLGHLGDWLRDELVPKLSPPQDYRARVAANLLKQLARELGSAGDGTAERDELAALLGEDGSRDDLVRALAKGIRSGAFDDRDEELRKFLRSYLTRRLKVTSPRWLPKET